jgi:predicted dehydrogenase
MNYLKYSDKFRSEKSVKWGIIGCGKVTEVKSGPAYQMTEGFELNAVMRRDREKLLDYVTRHKIPKYYESAEELINDPEIDAVYIATPPDSHRLYALKVAEAGKICCIEKPLASTWKDSLDICSTFLSKKIPLYVAYYRRSLPRFETIKTWIEDEKIGDIRHINWEFCKSPRSIDLSDEYNWRTDSNVASGGYFDDLASHGLDLFTFFLGNVIDAKGGSVNQQGLYSSKDAVVANWIHKGGITGTGFWNFGCYGDVDRVMIYGSKGEIEFPVFKDAEIHLRCESEQNSLFIENPVNVQLFHVRNIKKDLQSYDFEHPSQGVSALHTSWVMEKILEKI